MNTDKRVSRQVGLDTKKNDALNRIKDARSGVNRLDQAIHVFNLFTNLFIFYLG